MIKKTIIVLNILGLLGALIWLMTDQTWEPLVTSIGLIGALIALLFSGRQRGDTIMKQIGGKNSKNYQSKGDINVH
jgi:hypothetical protein